MKIEIKQYGSLPCELEVFIINGIEADEDDFGELIRVALEEYSCNVSGFKPKEHTQSVLEKYNITEDEYKSVCLKLNDTFSFGGCSLCV